MTKPIMLIYKCKKKKKEKKTIVKIGKTNLQLFIKLKKFPQILKSEILEAKFKKMILNIVKIPQNQD